MANKEVLNEVYEELADLYEIDKDVYMDNMSNGSFEDRENKLLESCLKAHLSCFKYVLSLLELEEEEEISNARFRKIRI